MAVRKASIILLLTHLCLVANAQVIRGRVTDRETGEPIPHASVYFSGSFRGTICDGEGNFALNPGDQPGQTITISAVGYYSHTLHEVNEEDLQIILLVPKRYEIPELSVSARSLERRRKRNLQMFRIEFLGTSYNARHCEILNEEVITFNYENDRDTLIAYAMEPIQIRNRALGYRVTYFLDHFEYDRRGMTTLFIGDILFNEDLSDPSTSLRTCERRRRYAYLGSCMHFFKSLWADDLGSTPFRIKVPGGDYLSEVDVVVQDEQGRKFFSFTEPLEVWYHARSSFAEFLSEQVYFEKTGYYDPTAILWRGDLGSQRVGDFLPFEYIPE